MTEIHFTVRSELTDAVLNTLFAAAWKGHGDTRFGSMFACSLTWVAA